MITKLVSALSTPAGWFVAITSMMLNNILGHAYSIFVVLLLVTIDMILGIRVSHKCGKFTLSCLLRDTVGKAEVYGICLLVFINIDALLPDKIGISTELVTTLILLAELWSSAASMLILHPNTPMLKLLQKKLTGEIATKLGVPEEEVETILLHNK